MGKASIHFLLVIAITASALFTFPSTASACSCALPPPAELFSASDAVFVGQVTPRPHALTDRPVTGALLAIAKPYIASTRFSYIYDRGIVKADVTVERSWKGVRYTEETIFVRLRCTAGLPAGEYLIYATEGEEGLRTSFCALMPTWHYTPYLDALETGGKQTIPLRWSPSWMWGAISLALIGLATLFFRYRHYFESKLSNR